ncbi:MAG: hypothetical protein QW680_10375 [Pyrobaculum sp.]
MIWGIIGITSLILTVLFKVHVLFIPLFFAVGAALAPGRPHLYGLAGFLYFTTLYGLATFYVPSHYIHVLTAALLLVQSLRNRESEEDYAVFAYVYAATLIGAYALSLEPRVMTPDETTYAWLAGLNVDVIPSVGVSPISELDRWLNGRYLWTAYVKGVEAATGLPAYRLYLASLPFLPALAASVVRLYKSMGGRRLWWVLPFLVFNALFIFYSLTALSEMTLAYISTLAVMYFYTAKEDRGHFIKFIALAVLAVYLKANLLLFGILFLVAVFTYSYLKYLRPFAALYLALDILYGYVSVVMYGVVDAAVYQQAKVALRSVLPLPVSISEQVLLIFKPTSWDQNTIFNIDPMLFTRYLLALFSPELYTLPLSLVLITLPLYVKSKEERTVATSLWVALISYFLIYITSPLFEETLRYTVTALPPALALATYLFEKSGVNSRHLLMWSLLGIFVAATTTGIKAVYSAGNIPPTFPLQLAAWLLKPSPHLLPLFAAVGNINAAYFAYTHSDYMATYGANLPPPTGVVFTNFSPWLRLFSPNAAVVPLPADLTSNPLPSSTIYISKQATLTWVDPHHPSVKPGCVDSICIQQIGSYRDVEIYAVRQGGEVTNKVQLNITIYLNSTGRYIRLDNFQGCLVAYGFSLPPAPDTQLIILTNASDIYLPYTRSPERRDIPLAGGTLIVAYECNSGAVQGWRYIFDRYVPAWYPLVYVISFLILWIYGKKKKA